MELKDILAISGQPGLFKYVAQSQRGVIVESLLDGKRMNAAATSRVSALTEISMFTEGEDIPLADVFTNIWNYTEGKEAISHKESAEKIQAELSVVGCRLLSQILVFDRRLCSKIAFRHIAHQPRQSSIATTSLRSALGFCRSSSSRSI